MSGPRKRTQFSPEALAYRRHIAESLGPFTPEQRAIIRGILADHHRQRRENALRIESNEP
ncbi:hypothetical protein E1281_25980 [Actinomadura sp. KC345]|uniref:hypothetical protein n=1 Tax=Actinomadura sp. KC345 TaxID=2530371 RepID=UPI00104A519D|nr:hypothetical protein [Actinomadura sp. KC345]TDC47653.1 hypothetical protein E1281_25980 [Actinomadura sp. KC345]